MKRQMRIIELLEKRTSSFHYSLGEIQKLDLNDLNNKAYVVRDNTLYRKAVDNSRLNRHEKADFEKNRLEKIDKSVISAQPIISSKSIISFQITLQKKSPIKSTSTPFIGLCKKNPKTQ